MRKAVDAILYLGLMLTGVGLAESGILPRWTIFPIIVLFLGFLVSLYFDGAKRGVIRGLFLALAFLLTGKAWSLGGVLIGIGLTLRSVGLERGSLKVVGLGEGLAVVGVFPFLPKGLSTVPVLAGVFLALGYFLSERIEELKESVLGFALLGGGVGAYISLRNYLLQVNPKLVLYSEWIALVVALVGAIGIVAGRGEDPEKYLEELLAERPGIRLPANERIEKAVREFLVKGRKAELLSYVAFYGSRTFGSREELLRLIEKLSEYEPKSSGVLTPIWLRRNILKGELERREKLVREIFEALKEGLR
ncbi:hypothetical protein [Thermococcus sp.]